MAGQPPPQAVDPWLQRFRAGLVATLGAAVAGIAALAFYTSFEAIRAFAVRSDGIAPEHAWAIPLLVDSFIIVATGADLWFAITAKERAWWEVLWPKLLLGSAALVSFVLNVAHAEPTFAARGVAAIPPAALVLGVELLMMVLRRATSMRAARLELAYESAHGELPSNRMTLGALIRRGPSEQRRSAAQVEEAEHAEMAARTREPGGAVMVAERVRTQPPLVAEAGSAFSPQVRRPSLPRRTSSMAPADYAIARRMARYIVEEREPGEVRTSEELLTAALGSKGITIDQRTARRLLREFDVPGASDDDAR